MIADADARVRSALRLLLEEELCAVVTGEAASAREALAAVEAGRPDALVLDWDLVADDGRRTVVGRLRAYCPALRIVALSRDSGAREGRPPVGADALVTKGEPPDRLLEALRLVRPR
ncbi:MAG TPA: response regulator [Chloroflexota bacterium]|nr:response regulator [Chloroflexota bacterium]